MQCVQCKPGWMFKNFRCVLNFENENAPYSAIQEFCSLQNSSLICFYDDVDLENCIKGVLPGNGYFVRFLILVKFYF